MRHDRLYLILDIYSRKIVGFEVHESDDSDHAVDLLRRTALAEGLHALAHKRKRFVLAIP
jgi:putative transposase